MVRLDAQCLSLFLGLFLLLFAVPPASAQEAPGLFTGAGSAQTTIDDVGQKRLKTLKQDSTTQSIRLVRLAGNLSQRRTLVMQANGAQGIAPTVHPVYERESADRGGGAERSSRKVKLFIQRDRLKALGEGTYIWRGTVRGGPGKQEAVGDVTLYHGTGGDITGTIRISGEYSLIRPLNGGLHALVAEDESKYDSGGSNPLQDGGGAQGSSSSSTSKSAPLPSSEASSQPSCEASTASLSPKEAGPEKALAQTRTTAPCPQYNIDVLAVYTSDAASNYSIDGIINTAIDEANQAYNNSNAGGVDLYLAHSQQVSVNGIGVGDIEDDLGDLQSSSSVQSLRDQHEADVVVLLTDEVYSPSGRADEIRAEAEDAFAIVEADDATGGQFTFPHEIGHLQGAQHHPNDGTCSQGDPDCDPEGHIFPDAYGHRFLVDCGSWPPWCTDDLYRTMMAYGNMTRVKHFSDPNVTFNGVSTGTSSQNNAGALRTTVGTVKHFRGASNLQALIDVISGDPYDPDVSQYTFGAEPCGGSGGYSYEWRISYHGPGNYGSVLGTQQTFSENFPPGTHWVKLTVHSSDGQQDSAITSITFDPYPSSTSTTAAKAGEESHPSNRKTARQQENPERLALRLAGPNPVETTTTLAYDLPERTSVKLVVYDIMGREVKQLASGSHRAGTYRVRLNGASLPSGVYVVRLQAGTKQKTRRITVVK